MNTCLHYAPPVLYENSSFPVARWNTEQNSHKQNNLTSKLQVKMKEFEFNKIGKKALSIKATIRFPRISEQKKPSILREASFSDSEKNHHLV